MKKTITIITIALIALLTLATTVNAAKLEVSTTDVKEGDIVEVILSLDSKTNNVDYTLTFDDEIFEPVTKEVDGEKMIVVESGLGDSIIANTPNKGEVAVAGATLSSKTDKVTIKFLAKKDGAAKFSAGSLNTGETAEELTVEEVDVKVEQKDAAPEETVAPTATAETTETTETPKATAKATATPKKTNNPKTGDNVAVYAGLAVVAIAAVAIVAKKYAK